MGKYLKGILGPFSGLVGTVVGATWKGLWVMRSRPVTTGKAPTQAQMVQRATFTLLSQFLSPLNDLLRIGFQAYNSELSPFNAAFAANSEQAVTGTYPNLTIDYPKIKLAKGRLLAVPDIAMATTQDARLDFSWVNNADPDSTNGTDKITFLVYNPAKQGFAMARQVVARSALSYNMMVPAMWSEDNVYVWAFFVKADGKTSSNSAYVGSTVVQ
jgi:hypothetical protein